MNQVKLPVIGPNSPIDVEANKAKYRIAHVCARCVRWYEGLDAGRKSELGKEICSSVTACSGLSALMGYPNYKGPMTVDDLRSTCATCGEPASKSAETADGRRIGYCATHFDSEMKRAERNRTAGFC